MEGPITVVSGKHRRLTIIECPSELSAMLDLSKVADLVLLMIDASFGFEMDTFEFINMLQVCFLLKSLLIVSIRRSTECLK